MRFFRLSSAVLLLMLTSACGSEPPYSGKPANRNVLRVLDINVWSGLDYIGNLWMGEYEPDAVREKRYRLLIEQIKELDPDIIGVHEANKLPDYAQRLGRDLGYTVAEHMGVGGVRGGPLGLPWNLREGDAILAKKDLRMEFAGRMQLSGDYVGKFFAFHFDDATQVIAVRVVNQGRPLYVFVTHWHASVLGTPALADELRKKKNLSKALYEAALEKINAGADWRLAEAAKTLRFIKKIAGRHAFILMGDFNATVDTPEIKQLIDFGMLDAFATANPGMDGFTWDPGTNLNIKKFYAPAWEKQPPELYGVLDQMHEAAPKRIDLILLGPTPLTTMKIRSSRVVLNKILGGLHTSDHYGIFAEIEFKR